MPKRTFETRQSDERGSVPTAARHLLAPVPAVGEGMPGAGRRSAADVFRPRCSKRRRPTMSTIRVADPRFVSDGQLSGKWPSQIV